jgi:hypothetical protein
MSRTSTEDRIEHVTTQVARQLAPLLGMAQSTTELTLVAQLVPKIRPMVAQMLHQANGPDSEPINDTIAMRATNAILPALIAGVLPSATTLGAVTRMLGQLPTLLAEVNAHFAQVPVIDKQDGPIVHDDGAPAVHE